MDLPGDIQIPGFNIGGGNEPDQKLSVAEPRRKHRWIITGITSGSGKQIIPAGTCVYLQKASRPTFKLEPVDMHHDQEVAHFAGKQTWEPINLSWYDIENPVDVSTACGQWVQSVVKNFFRVSNKTQVALPQEYKSTIKIQVRNGDGDPTETWVLYNAWPESSNWGELDYTTSELLMVEVSVKYDRAELVKGAA